MKLYRSLSEAIAFLQRKPKEVIAIISLNGQAYFVFRSNPSPDVATMKQAQAKLAISRELSGQVLDADEDKKKTTLYQLLVNDGIPHLYPESNHAEENLIRGFPELLNQFKSTFPGQKILNITIFLTLSPCSEKGEKKHSDARQINGFFLPAGCDSKLSVFFDKGNYQALDSGLFHKTKIKVQYLQRFNHRLEDSEPFIEQADPLLHSVLSQKLWTCA
ncbi:hypothetical protein [Legionella erythra]|uniref:Uncharacterized protein n=1 Tax=Legionella erythra TaxID=448 RepID=A0A0W0TU54_LEGER|nr:hypothetical protein [Legionella erythra]KTC99191.1 hypothetical protein Lery_0584 [Legionella erythra]